MACTFAFLIFVTGCGGAKVLKEPEPLEVVNPLATATDDAIAISLYWVIFRDGPGAWAKNVDWDEYLLSMRNLTKDPLQIAEISVVDSLGFRINSAASRKELVKGSKQVKRRYKDQGLRIRAGASGGRLVATGLGAGTIAVASGGSIMTASSAAMAGTAAGLVIAPVLLTGGIIRGVNNRKVNGQIEARHSSLPHLLRDGQEQRLDVFFPVTPSPQRVEVKYFDAEGNDRLIVLNTRSALNGLHLEDTTDR